ncbi:hypothetical protein RRG08_057848 [Elysia crispata]|uniref:Uncharacterized protein n=1 Tax=Elysia crispata TaxID=231223 RepID=A0AAE1AZN1_9GAST|nr:hypothetical protein RRG08_057848 [Elysia crispata]
MVIGVREVEKIVCDMGSGGYRCRGGVQATPLPLHGRVQDYSVFACVVLVNLLIAGLPGGRRCTRLGPSASQVAVAGSFLAPINSVLIRAAGQEDRSTVMRPVGAFSPNHLLHTLETPRYCNV